MPAQLRTTRNTAAGPPGRPLSLHPDGPGVVGHIIQHTARRINAVAKAQLLYTGPQGRFSLSGVTLWVYLPMIFVLLFWVVLLFIHPKSGVFSHSLGGALILASLLVSFLINWAVPECTSPLILNGLNLESESEVTALQEAARTNTCTGIADTPLHDGNAVGGNPVM